MSNHALLNHARMLAVAIGTALTVAHGAGVGANDVPHGPVDSLHWESEPGSTDSQAILYRSPDGARVAAAFRETGKRTFTYPFDEFGHVITGTAKAYIHGGPTITLAKGDVFYFREGMTVDFEFGKDFSDVTLLVSTHKVEW